MAEATTVVGASQRAKLPIEIEQGIGTIEGVYEVAALGASGDGFLGGSTTQPIMGIAGSGAIIDDAVYVDPGDGSMGTELVHTLHNPATNPAYRNEAPR